MTKRFYSAGAVSGLCSRMGRHRSKRLSGSGIEIVHKSGG